MSKVLKFAALGLALSLAPLAASAQPHAGTVKIERAWIRPNPPGAPTAAGYLTITNPGHEPDRLVGGSSPQVGKIEIHEMSMAGGVMKMRPVAGGLAIPPGATVKLEPGGYHVMLIGPKRAFRPGEHVPVTLRFEHAGAVKVDFAVQTEAPGAGASHKPGASQTDMSHMDMH